MIRFLAVFLAIVALGSAVDAQAKTLASEAELRPLTDRIMTHVAKMAFDEAGALAQTYTELPEEEMKTLMGRVKLQMNSYLPRFGSGVGYEFIKQEQVGDSVIRLVYIAKHEKHALPWTFVFYKAPEGWMLDLFFFNDNLNTLF